MQIGLVRLTKLRFPIPAGTYQDQAATAALVRELGDNYASYHQFLQRELAAVGTRPERSKFADMQSYLEAWAWAQEIVLAEALLRNCRAYRRHGRSLDEPVDPAVPLLTATDELVSVEAAP